MIKSKKGPQGPKESYIPFGEPATFQLEEEYQKEPGGDGWLLLVSIAALAVLLVLMAFDRL